MSVCLSIEDANNALDAMERLKTTIALFSDEAVVADFQNGAGVAIMKLRALALNLEMFYTLKRNSWTLTFNKTDVDENGMPLYDEDGNPMWVNRRREVGTIEEAEDLAYLFLGADNARNTPTVELVKRAKLQ